MATTKPKFLVVPPLYEQGSATVSWENQPDAFRYELDIVFNEDFEAAGRGKTWADTELADWSWSDQEEPSGLTWKEIEALPAQGLMWRNLEFMDRTWEEWDTDPEATWKAMQQAQVRFTAYSGPGEEIAAPDQGLTWGDMDRSTWSWADQDLDTGLTWKEISLLPSVGLLWCQHDQNSYTWAELENTYESWAALENQPPRGLGWGSLEGRWMTWGEIETQGENGDGLTWWELEHLPPDNQTHRGVTIDLPLYTKSSMLRIRAFDGEDTPTDYLTTVSIKHLPRSLAKYKPPCLHIPTLYEGRSAEITWGDLYGASGYVLERKCGGDYEVRYDGAGRPGAHPADCKAVDEHYYGPDCKQHLACSDHLPYYQKSAQYRIKGSNATNSSQYLESAVVPIVPVFYREETLSVQAGVADKFAIQVDAKTVRDYKNIAITMEYDPTVLQLMNTIYHSQYGVPLRNRFEVLSQSLGKLVFRCKKDGNRVWSGANTLIYFRPLRTGNTVVRFH